jgi:hypothetical protein
VKSTSLRPLPRLLLLVGLRGLAADLHASPLQGQHRSARQA